MRLNRLFVYFICMVCAWLSGCDEATTGGTCIPNETVVCSCGDGEDEVNGLQSCNETGTDFSSCSCDESDEDGEEEESEE